MINVPADFFREEVRSGYTVSELMKRVWASYIKIYDAVRTLCEANDIMIYAMFGTMLGAARHHGFIPWDDDMDIGMLRSDYMKFIQLSGQLPYPYSVKSIYTQEAFSQFHAVVTNSRTPRLEWEDERIREFYGCPFIVGLDIFPLDYIPADPNKKKLQELIYKLGYSLAHTEENDRSGDEFAQKLMLMQQYTGYKFTDDAPLMPQIYKLTDAVAANCKREDADSLNYYAHIGYQADPSWSFMPLDGFEDTVTMPFEYTDITLPGNYELLLEKRFGDWHKEIQAAPNHDFPFYNKQIEYFKFTGDWNKLQGADCLHIKNERKVEEVTGHKYKMWKDVHKSGNRRKLAVFLPYNVSMWDSLESVWQAAEADPDTDTLVVPIPYYDKDASGRYIRKHYEIDRYPADVPVTRYTDVDLHELRPDYIFIHNPYDQYNYVTTVDPEYYNDKLKQCTDKLIYIPYFVLGEPGDDIKGQAQALKNFIEVPGMIHSDMSFVQSEKMRKVCVECLSQFAGEETREHWQQAIYGTGSPKTDHYLNLDISAADIPEEWKKILYPGNKKQPVIFFNTSIGTFMRQREDALKKIESVLSFMKRCSSKVTLLWRPHPLTIQTLDMTAPELSERYRDLVEKYKAAGWGIYDDTPDMDLAFYLSDAYYGDWSSVVWLYEKTGKSVLISDQMLREYKAGIGTETIERQKSAEGMSTPDAMKKTALSKEIFTGIKSETDKLNLADLAEYLSAKQTASMNEESKSFSSADIEQKSKIGKEIWKIVKRR